MPVDAPYDHNQLLVQGYKRADALVERLTRVLEPILKRAGDQAAKNFEHYATDHLTAALETGQADVEDKAMVALYPRLEEAQALADGSESPESMHVTLAFLGEITDDDAQRVVDALAPVAGTHPPLVGEVGGVALFKEGPDGHPAVLLPDVPGLVELRQDVATAIANADGVDFSRLHGYTPHLTVDYAPDPNPPDQSKLGQPLHFDGVAVVKGNRIVASHPLTGAPALTASSPWTAPVPNELLNVDKLVAEIRAKTDPVRNAAVKSVMTPALEGVGIAWDATEPLTAKVLSQAGSQVTNIAETTQANVMRTIGTSYEAGLSIPDTAKVIQAGMSEAALPRATLIARTEMAGAVNGGSLAAAKIAEQATGGNSGASFKVWLTAPGAMFPRHEEYDDLDGQTVPLEGLFDVGGEQLEYPGDPAGDPSEVCNCRCTLEYTDQADESGAGGSGGGMDVGTAVAAEGVAVEGGSGAAAAHVPEAIARRSDRAAELAAMAQAKPVSAASKEMESALRDIARGTADGGAALVERDELRGAVSYGEKLVGLGSNAKKTLTVLNLGSDVSGGGTALLQHAAQEAVNRGLDTLRLESLTEARGFYEKLGFENVGGDRYELSGDALRGLAEGRDTPPSPSFSIPNTAVQATTGEWTQAELEAQRDWVKPPATKSASMRKAGGYSSDRGFGTNTKMGDWAEDHFSDFTGGQPLVRTAENTARQLPFDVRVDGYLFEVKACSTESTKLAATPKRAEIMAKKEFAKQAGLEPAIVVPVLDRDSGLVSYYWRPGVEGGRVSERTGWRYMGSQEVADWPGATDEAAVTPDPPARAERTGDLHLDGLNDEVYDANTQDRKLYRIIKETQAAGGDADAFIARRNAVIKYRGIINKVIKGKLDLRAERTLLDREIAAQLPEAGSGNESASELIRMIQARKAKLADVALKPETVAKTQAETTAAKTGVTGMSMEQLDFKWQEELLDYPNSAAVLRGALESSGADYIVLEPLDAWNGDYIAQRSIVFQHEGVIFRVEVQEGTSAQTAYVAALRQGVTGFVDDIPEAMRTKDLQVVQVLSGTSPDEAYWAKEYNMSSFNIAAQGGRGRITFWHGYRSADRGTFNHELGHIIGTKGGPKAEAVGVGPESRIHREWAAAQKADQATTTALQEQFTATIGLGRDEMAAHGVLLGKTGVTGYGGVALKEDWAESVSLLLQSRRDGGLVTADLKDGTTKRYTFEELFPERAKLIDEMFPGVS